LALKSPVKKKKNMADDNKSQVMFTGFR